MDALAADPAVATLAERWPRALVVEAVRREIDAVRRALAADPAATPDGPEDWAARVEARLTAADVPSLRRVVNATGVVLHTNLGRAPLANAARDAMAAAASGYSNLEYDLDEGRRGSRYDHCVSLLRELTGAEDALVVNNCAAALMLALNTVAAGRGVAVSRGELVEIGGGFRVPEVMERSGARLVEVGSTNRTRLGDYREAVETGDVAALLKVHRSNFRVTGFTEEAGLAELAALAVEHDLPLVHDLGSGLLADPAALGLPDEPRASGSLAAGADVVAISGDKLLGGPQAGILLGRSETVAALRRNPMCRALRVDKVTLAGLEATLRLYRAPEQALRTIPTLRMLAAPVDEVERRARALADGLELDRPVRVAPGDGAVGGGTYPGVTIPSWTVRIGGAGVDAFATALRDGDPPVVARVESDEVVVDLRTVAPGEEEPLVRRLRAAASRPTS